MTTKAQALTIITLAATLMVAQGQTNQATATETPALNSTEQTIQDIKNPTPWLTWGGDFRVRNEYFDDMLTLSPKNKLHEQDMIRFRARIWTSIMPVEDLSLNVRLADEVREWMKPAGYTGMKTSSTTGREGLDWREGIFDSLNVAYKNIAGLPAAITVGRQDYVPGRDSLAGDGWLLGDGTPLDGSWTYYLDSARFSYEFKDQHTKVEAMGIIQDAHDDAWMPTINPNHLLVTEQNEKGAIVQVANSSLKAANLAGYFVYKNDTKVASNGDNADIYTFGGRLTGSLDDNWQYSMEGAYQFGRKADTTVKFPEATAGSSAYRGLSAYGLNSKLSYLFKDKLNNKLDCSFELLSGDNSKTGSDEMFDVLWGRWPRWSEIGLYSYAAETRIGQEANLIRFGPTWTLNPMKDMEFSASYYALLALEDVPTREASSTLFSGNSNFRGHFASAMLTYKFSRHLKGHLWSEFLFPGNYYTSRTLISFLRAELYFTF
jgi:hypothetical protein